MADDEDKQKSLNDLSADEVVDIDSLKVKVMILCKHENKLAQVATFLNRRGWEAIVITKLEEGIQKMATTRPDFVLISMNMPSKKISMLPQFFTQTFNARCIVYAEDHDSKTTGQLHAARTPYKIMGAVSGPTVHRRIKKVLQELYTKKNQSSASKSGSATQAGAQMIKGGASGDIDQKNKPKKASDFPMRQTFKKSEAENGFDDVAKKPKNKSFHHIKSGDASEIGGMKEQNNELIIPEASKKDKKSAAENLEEINRRYKEMMGEELDKSDSSFAMDDNDATHPDSLTLVQKNDKLTPEAEAQVQKREKMSPDGGAHVQKRDSVLKDSEHKQGATQELTAEELAAAQGKAKIAEELAAAEGKAKEASEKSAEQGALDAKELSAEAGAKDSGEHSATQGGPDSKEHSVMQEGSETTSGSELQKGPDSGAHSELQKGPGATEASTKANGGDEDSESASLNKNKKSKSRKKKKRNDLPEDKGFLYKSIEECLSEILENEEDYKIEVQDVQKMGVISLHSEDLSGYLLFACADPGFAMQEFLKKFKRALTKKLDGDSHEIIVDNDFVVDVNMVDFDNLSSVKGEFTIIDNEKDYEMLVTFHQRGQTLPVISQPIGKIKTEIRPEDIATDVQTTFDSYLYLTKNKKYFLFLRKGGFLQKKQKEKLMKNKVTLHIGRNEVDAFFQFYITNVINELIDEVNNEDSQSKAS